MHVAGPEVVSVPQRQPCLSCAHGCRFHLFSHACLAPPPLAQSDCSERAGERWVKVRRWMGGCIGISPSYGTLRVSTASLAAREVFCIQASKQGRIHVFSPASKPLASTGSDHAGTRSCTNAIALCRSDFPLLDHPGVSWGAERGAARTRRLSRERSWGVAAPMHCHVRVVHARL
jgi:hypothetical protein